MRIVLQIGYSKSNGRKREGQKVDAFVNDVKCTWDDREGQFLTSFLDTRRGKLWYLWSGNLEDGDVIRIQAFTAILGGGKDERRTFESIYVVDEKESVQEVEVSGVGMRRYPLLKGRVATLGSVSEADLREAEIEEFLSDENF
jgi:hypothetical protein